MTRIYEAVALEILALFALEILVLQCTSMYD